MESLIKIQGELKDKLGVLMKGEGQSKRQIEGLKKKIGEKSELLVRKEKEFESGRLKDRWELDFNKQELEKKFEKFKKIEMERIHGEKVEIKKKIFEEAHKELREKLKEGLEEKEGELRRGARERSQVFEREERARLAKEYEDKLIGELEKHNIVEIKMQEDFDNKVHEMRVKMEADLIEREKKFKEDGLERKKSLDKVRRGLDKKLLELKSDKKLTEVRAKRLEEEIRLKKKGLVEKERQLIIDGKKGLEELELKRKELGEEFEDFRKREREDFEVEKAKVKKEIVDSAHAELEVRTREIHKDLKAKMKKMADERIKKNIQDEIELLQNNLKVQQERLRAF